MNEHENSEQTNETVETQNADIQEKVENTPERLEEARKKAAENWDLFLRTRADADNIRRRAVIDVENAHKYGIEKFAREILDVVDSIDHGLTASSADTDSKALKEGMVLTYKLLIDTLDKFGIKQLNPQGEMFDPLRHEAMSAQVNKDLEPNTVLMVVQKGFTLHDRLLRAAKVIVSKTE